MRIRSAAVLLLLACLGACDRDDIDYAVGTIERHRIDLVADSGEPVVALYVQEGDPVTPGMALLEQDSTKLTLTLTQAEAELAMAAAQLKEAESGPRAQEIDQARAQLAAAKSALATAEHELARQTSLIAQNYASESTVNILQGQVDGATAEVNRAQARLDEMLAGTRSERVDQARAGHAAMQARVANLRVDLERAVIRASVSGQVESILARVGERPLKGQTVIALLADERTFARVHIPEPLRTRLNPGDPASIRIDGHAQEYAGQIRWISSEAAFTPYYALIQHDRSRLAYLAEIDLELAQRLPNGIPAEVRFPALEAP